MTNGKRSGSLDQVLADYAHASEKFDAKVLQAFIDKYPDHARALQRYAHIQLTSAPATQDEINEEELLDQDMLPRQSRLLQHMQQLRKESNTTDASEAASKLAMLSGINAMQAAATAVFGSYEHGEDLLLYSVTESSDIHGIPGWFYDELGAHINVPAAALIAGMALKRQQPSNLQRYSSKNKPSKLPSLTWKQLVESCILDEAVKAAILERSKRS